MNQLDTFSKCIDVAAARRLQRALEVIDDRQKIAECVRRERLGPFAPIALDPLAVVVELGRRAKQAVLERVFFAAQRLEGRLRRLLFPRLGGRAGRLLFVDRVVWLVCG
jgi:hypothetical protein